MASSLLAMAARGDAAFPPGSGLNLVRRSRAVHFPVPSLIASPDVRRILQVSALICCYVRALKVWKWWWSDWGW